MVDNYIYQLFVWILVWSGMCFMVQKRIREFFVDEWVGARNRRIILDSGEILEKEKDKVFLWKFWNSPKLWIFYAFLCQIRWPLQWLTKEVSRVSQASFSLSEWTIHLFFRTLKNIEQNWTKPIETERNGRKLNEALQKIRNWTNRT